MRIRKKDALIVFCRANQKLLGYCGILLLFLIILLWKRGCAKEDPICTKYDLTVKEYEMKRMSAMIDHLVKSNRQLKTENIHLQRKIGDDNIIIQEPTLEYEKHKRRLWTTIHNLFSFINFKVDEAISNGDQNSHLKSALYEYKLSLMNDFNKMTENDGYEKWRQMEAKDLGSTVQKRFNFIQNPIHCEKAKILKCSKIETESCDWGCQLQHITECLIAAYSTQRVLIYNASDLPFYKLYEPLSKTCVNADENTTNEQTTLPGIENKKIVGLRELHVENSLFGKIPADLASRIEKLYDDPNAWWLGEIRKYLLRPSSELTEIIQKVMQKTMFKKATVCIQVRKDEKTIQKSNENYMKIVEEYYDLLELNQPVEKRRVFVASDDQSIGQKIQIKYPNYEVFSTAEINDILSYFKYRVSVPSLKGIITELHLLHQCDFIVATFSSVIGRILFEIMNTHTMDAYKKIVTVDGLYYSGNITFFKSIYKHRASEQGELKSEVGDVFYDNFHVHSNGLWNLYNNKTKAYGKVPAFKLEKLVDREHFPKYESLL